MQIQCRNCLCSIDLDDATYRNVTNVEVTCVNCGTLNNISTKDGTLITLLFDPGTGQIKDMLRMYPTSQYTNGKNPFEDGFLNNTVDRFQVDTRYGGTRDGFAGISFSNRTEIFEISHPLCSGDKSDLCVSPDTPVGLSFMLNTTNNSAIWNPSGELAFSAALGLYYQERYASIVTPREFFDREGIIVP